MNHNAVINIAKKQLRLEEDDYRAILLRLTGKASLKLMNTAEKDAVVTALKAKGFRTTTGKRRPAAPRSDLRLIHKLWTLLGQAGKLDRPGRDGLNAFIRKRFGAHWQSVPVDVDALRDRAQIDAVINALKTWCKREGIVLNAKAGPGRKK